MRGVEKEKRGTEEKKGIEEKERESLWSNAAHGSLIS